MAPGPILPKLAGKVGRTGDEAMMPACTLGAVGACGCMDEPNAWDGRCLTISMLLRRSWIQWCMCCCWRMRTSVIALLDREYTPARALEYQQVDAQERAIVKVQSY